MSTAQKNTPNQIILNKPKTFADAQRMAAKVFNPAVVVKKPTVNKQEEPSNNPFLIESPGTFSSSVY